MFDIAKMAGKQDKMGTLNPLLRQGLGSGKSPMAIDLHSLIGVEVAQAALFLASGTSPFLGRRTCWHS
jgi:hypothetical protein